MNKLTLSACVLLVAYSLPLTSHAELNDRTKKLLQTQSVNRQQSSAASPKKDPPADTAARDSGAAAEAQRPPVNRGDGATPGRP